MSDQNAIFTHKPQINLSCPSSGRMWIIFCCALACVIQSALNDGGRSIVLAVTALLTALITEFFFTFRKYGARKILDGSTSATAMILVMILPNFTSPFHVVVASIFAIAVVKYSFGGLGSNWFNPALGGWLLIRFSWPEGFVQALGDFSVSDYASAGNASAAGGAVTEFLNNTILSVAGVQLPAGYIDLLFYSGQGLITDRGLFILLIGTILITAIGINKTWIPI
ncbi:MAG: RnfABCDGE type electron transport complex subunit D, partial [Treponema sp.]|nr:RnfABCDGE type electron transport complex subunit D [Treponema sp.]